MTEAEAPEQLALVPAAKAVRKSRAKAAPVAIAAMLPVARVAVDMPLAHLDRLFDYAVPAALADKAVPGCRVKIRFAGKLVDGFLIERLEHSDHDGKLAPLAKVVSPEPVLRPDVLDTARRIADRYAGTLADVLRLAVPPRHARAESAVRPSRPTPLPPTDPAPWAGYDGAAGYLDALAAGRDPRACWSALPGSDPAVAIATAVSAVLHSGRGAIVVVPDARDIARFDAAFTAVLGENQHVVLHADQGPAARYSSFLALSRGEVKAVVGTRSAVFAPVHDLGLVVVWDDGDDLFSEPRAPYPHARETLLTRALGCRGGVLIGGFARSADAQNLVETQWCASLEPAQESRRSAWPRLEVSDGSVAGGAPARLPHQVFAAIRKSAGATLIQVPRRGYRATLACQDCRVRAECAACHGPLTQTGANADPVCRWCGLPAERWQCPHCHSRRLRAPIVGALRTAEEIAQAFGDIPVLTSGGTDVLDTVPAGRVIVLATPGAEPIVPGGYDVVVLLDTWLMLGRPDLRIDEEAHRRWFNALALAGPGGVGVAVGEAAQLQALVRADPVGFAKRELAHRAEAHMPPAARIATVESAPEIIAELAVAEWPPDTQVLGPVPVPDGPHAAGRERLILRVPRARSVALAASLKQLQAARAAAKLPPLRVQVDPLVF